MKDDFGDVRETMTDGTLIAAFLGGDEAAFESLYCRYRGNLYAFLLRLTGNAAEAEEVFSATWLRALNKLPRYRDDGKFGAWLLRIGRNDYWDRCRKRKRHPTETMDGDQPLAVASPQREDPAEKLAASETGKAIEAALKTLPPEQREVFLLRQEDWSFREIAALQKISINTVLSRMQYALRALRKILAAEKEKIR